MKIGLYNLEPAIVNTAMMQVSTYCTWEEYQEKMGRNYGKS